MPGSDGRPGYIADCMLGSLAKWLRVLGHDVVYHRRTSDDRLVAEARRNDRILLTRDTRLVQRRTVARGGVRCVLIESDRPEEQLAQMVERHGLALDPDRFLTRCLRCNEPTVRVKRESVEDLVPHYVFRTQETFSRCPACGRVYWKATHVDSILERLPRGIREGIAR